MVYKNKEIVFGGFRVFRVNDEIPQIPYLPKIPTIIGTIREDSTTKNKNIY
jgi:hypothetical protein